MHPRPSTLIWGDLILWIGLSACAGSLPTGTPSDRVLIPAGPFLMGTAIDNDREWGDTDEEPVHEVFLDAYRIDRYEVTARDYSEFLNAHPNHSMKYFLRPA